MATTRPDPTPEDDPALSTLEFIAEARRPLLVERHRELVEEMEQSLSDAFIAGSVDNPRLKAIILELESGSEQARIAKTVKSLAEDPHHRDKTLQLAMIEELCLLRERGSIEIATLQNHVIGIYRWARVAVADRQRSEPSLADLRKLPTTMLGRLLTPLKPRFGSETLGDTLVYTPSVAERTLASAKRLRRAAAGDDRWRDAAGDPPLPRADEEEIDRLPTQEREAVRAMAVQNRVRSEFYRQVFLTYLNRDELDPRDVEAHPTVLSWLEAIEDTPHLFPFMQGQTSAQKLFRLSQLLQKLVQIHEMYSRLERASESPELKPKLVDKSLRERLGVMAKAHYPPLPLSNDMTVAILCCPFAAFVEWVQDLVVAQDFVLPPDPRR